MSTNVLTDNVTTPLIKPFLKAYESSRVLTRTVDTQLLSGVFSPHSGATVDFKRPHDWKTDRTATGDISSLDQSDIVAGKATGTVQDYMTAHADWDQIEEALHLGGLDQIMEQAANRISTDLELDFGAYMYKNCNLSYGTPGTAVDSWTDVAGSNALAVSVGVTGEMNYVMNPYTAVNLANVQHGLSSGSNDLVDKAWRDAMVAPKMGNMNVLQSNALASYTSGTCTDRAGTLSATPNGTYATNKNTMTQTLAVTGLTTAGTITAGEIVEVTGRNRLSLATRSTFTDGAGAEVLWRGVVTADVTLSGGAGNIVVAGPAINEANGQYNTVNSALASGDIITILGSASTVYQPSMFYAKQAFGIGFVQFPKLYATDSVVKTKDGMYLRICKYSDGDTNKQKVRFDILPAYVTFDPFKAGQGFGA